MYNEEWIVPELEEQMQIVLDLVNLGRAARNVSELKIRQPLQKMSIVSDKKLDEKYIPLLADELNVKEIKWITDASNLQDYQFKPQLRLLGPRFGKKLPQVNKALAEVDGQAKYEELQAKGHIEIVIDDQLENLSQEELIISSIQAEGLATASDNDVTIALDTVLTKELIDEGNVREIISKVQHMRRESGFEVANRINLYYGNNEKLAQTIAKYADTIKGDVLAKNIAPIKEEIPFVKTLDINGQELTIGMEVVE